MIAFNVGIPEQFVVLGDSKIYVSDDLLGSDFSAEFASALAHTELKADSDKSGNKLYATDSEILISGIDFISDHSQSIDVNISPEGQISSPISIGIAEYEVQQTTFNPVNFTFIPENSDSELEIGQHKEQISAQISEQTSPNLGKIAKLNVPENITANSISEATTDIEFEESDSKTVEITFPKISSKGESNLSAQAIEQPLAINQQAGESENFEHETQTKPLQANEATKTQNIEFVDGLSNGIKSAKSLHQINSEQNQPNTEVKSAQSASESISQIIAQINQNQTIQQASTLVVKNVVEIPQMNDDVQLKITLDGIVNNLAKSNQVAPKTEQNNQVQQNLEHLTLLSKGIFDKNFDFSPQKSNKTQNVNDATINISQNPETAIIGSNQAKNDQQMGFLHKIVQNPEHIAINAESSNTESDESFSKENKSNSQSNEKNAATKENNFVSQVKSESHKADSAIEVNENNDLSVKLPKQSDDSEISEIYNKISPFAQKSNIMLVNNHKLTDFEAPIKEFSGVKLSDIPRRIMQLATTQASDGTSSAKLVMNPKSLGTIVVHLEIVKNVVKLHLTGEKQEALSAVESTIGLLKERLQSKGLILDNIEYNLNDSGEHSNLGKHNHADKENKHIKHTYNNEKQSESSEGNDKFHDNKILRHDNGTIIEKYI